MGTIEEILPEESGRSSIAVIEPGTDVNNVKHVFVITDFETAYGQQAEQAESASSAPAGE